MMLEKVDATFLDQTAVDGPGVPTKAHFEQIFSTLAVLHAHCWGKTDAPGLNWVNSVDGMPRRCKKTEFQEEKTCGVFASFLGFSIENEYTGQIPWLDRSGVCTLSA
jgi:hypothetical protein